MQLVEIRERVEEVAAQRSAGSPTPETLPEMAPLFAARSDDELLGYGVPAEWLVAVPEANEDTLFEVADHRPQEAAEALLDLATGATPEALAIAAPATTSLSAA